MSPPGENSEAGPRHRDRPTAESPDEKLDGHDTPSAAHTPRRHAGLGAYLLDDEPARWVADFTRTLAGDVELPLFGSPAWESADDRLRIASAVRAGEAWRRAGLCLAQDLADEIARAGDWLDADADAWISAACRNLARQPSHAELVDRRAS